MTSPFLAEIRMFAGNFAPRGNAFCDGAIMPVQQNTALFSLLGTSFGGNGTSNFALPNFQSNVPVGTGNGPGLTPRVLGEAGGSASVTVLQNEMPLHPHGLQAIGGRGVQSSPAPVQNAELCTSAGGTAYAPYAAGSTTPLALQTTTLIGGSQPHNNMMPSLALTFIIATSGVYPPRN
jgi:microcystin-dependent protein